MLHSHSSASLSIHVSSATELVTAQTFGKQDPFMQFSLNFEEKNEFLKTFTHKNAGENATWNQTFTISLNGEADLFVEVLNEETTVNEVIGFAAIPINQVVHAPGANMNGLFEIYNVNGERAGLLNLQLAALGFPNSQPADFNGQPIRGQSYVHEGHCARMKSSKKKSTGVAVGGAILGAGLAIGAGFLGKKLYDDHEEEEREKEEQEAEAQRQREEEESRRRQDDEKRQHEREELDQERARYDSERAEFEREKSSYKSEHEKKDKKDCHRKEKDDCESDRRHHKKKCDDDDERENRRHHKKECDDDDERDNRRHHKKDSDDDDDDDRDAKKWNPVGTYAPGDRVKYHGQVYMCLQGHTSNPTWNPSVARSLWQSE